MRVLAVDTALQRCSVVVMEDGRVLAERVAGMEKGHAEHLAPMAAAVLAEAACRVADLDRVGVVVGPGGFTGVRIALAFARGLAIGRSLPVIGVSSLAALAAAVEDAAGDAAIAAVIDARRGQLYAALFDSSGDELIAPFAASPEQVVENVATVAGDRPIAAVGSGVEIVATRTNWRRSAAPAQIDIRAVARLTALRPAPSGPPAPLYLRAPDAKPPRPGLFDALQRR